MVEPELTIGRPYIPFEVLPAGIRGFAAFNNGFLYSTYRKVGASVTGDVQIASYDLGTDGAGLSRSSGANASTAIASTEKKGFCIALDERSQNAVLAGEDYISSFRMVDPNSGYNQTNEDQTQAPPATVSLVSDLPGKITGVSIRGNEVAYCADNTLGTMDLDSDLKLVNRRESNLFADQCCYNPNATNDSFGGMYAWNRWNGLFMVDTQMRSLKYGRSIPLTINDTDTDLSTLIPDLKLEDAPPCMYVHPSRNFVAVARGRHAWLWDQRKISQPLFTEKFDTTCKDIVLAGDEMCILKPDKSIESICLSDFSMRERMYLPPKRTSAVRYHDASSQWPQGTGSTYYMHKENSSDAIDAESLSANDSSVFVLTPHAMLQIEARRRS